MLVKLVPVRPLWAGVPCWMGWPGCNEPLRIPILGHGARNLPAVGHCRCGHQSQPTFPPRLHHAFNHPVFGLCTVGESGSVAISLPFPTTLATAPRSWSRSHRNCMATAGEPEQSTAALKSRSEDRPPIPSPRARRAAPRVWSSLSHRAKASPCRYTFSSISIR